MDGREGKNKTLPRMIPRAVQKQARNQEGDLFDIQELFRGGLQKYERGRQESEGEKVSKRVNDVW